MENGKRQLQGTQISLVHGDIFLSPMQTVTIAVNTVGVMGGGLAAHARRKFPRLYAEFQKQCRANTLTTQTPYLYNGERRLLLFATKQDWRNPSEMEYLRDGLRWLKENAAKVGITSLAVPALGCGLGGLRREEVLPLLCQNLRELDMPCEIYLPLEEHNTMPDAQLTEGFLLGSDA